MTTIADINDTIPTHLLLIGQTKSGKTKFTAEAAKAGATILFLDADHGYATLKRSLSDNVDAAKRVHYLKLHKPLAFMQELIRKETLYYVPRYGTLYSNSLQLNDNDDIIRLATTKIPKEVIMVIDSWTGIAMDTIEQVANELSVNALTAKGNAMRPVYANAGRITTNILKALQYAPWNVIVLAHPELYEQRKRPKGRGVVREEDMEIVRTVHIPLSVSKPHGYTIGKFFTDIGVLSVDRLGKSVLSYKRDSEIIAGGTLDIKGNAEEELSYVNTFGITPVNKESNSWIKTMKISEYKELRKKGEL